MKKRGAAYGIMAAGSGLGGVILPIMVSHIMPKIGYGWSMRVCGFLILGLMAIANVTVKSRLPPRPRTFKIAHFIEPFTDMRWVTITISSFLFFMGLFIPINFVEVQSLAAGMSVNLASYLIPILNAGRYDPSKLVL